MEGLVAWIVAHADHAHWFIFAAILLAGMNIPISADFIIIASAVLAATTVPEHTIHLFLAVFLGCYFSAWIAYWIGRALGPKLLRWKFFAKILNPERMGRAKHFYEKHGFLTLLIGRFIPFGVRNAIFMSTGMSRVHFGKFLVKDALACFIWTSVSFYLFYVLGQNYQTLYSHVKTFNLLIFSVFSVSVIGVIWYKRKKKAKLAASDTQD